MAIDAAPEPAKFMRKFEIPGFVYSVGAIAALLLIWEALVATGIISSFLLPAPSQIFRSLADNFSLIMSMSVATTAEFLLGFAMAVLVGAAAWRAHRLFAADTADDLSAARRFPKHSEARDRTYYDRLARHGSHVQSGHCLCHRLLPHRGRYGDWATFRTRRDRTSRPVHGRQRVRYFSAMCAFRMPCPRFLAA